MFKWGKEEEKKKETSPKCFLGNYFIKMMIIKNFHIKINSVIIGLHY